MPIDNEIHFGFYGRKIVEKTIADLNIPIYDEDTDETLPGTHYSQATDPELLLESFEPTFTRIFLKIANRLGWSHISTNSDGYHLFDTPFGKRETPGFTLCLQHDPYEVGDSHDDISLGFNLSSRYFPSVLDIKNSSGTMHGIPLEDYLPALEICREEIIKEFPIFIDAKTYTRDIFY